MSINKAEFIKSSSEFKQLPQSELPEYAFIGRSNVGKSSLINMLTNSTIAKTSKTPGKTKHINHFLINSSWLLADLPGYGYASVSKKIRAQWTPLIKDYLCNRDNLCCIMLLIDSRLQAQAIDLEFLEFLGLNDLAFVIVFTKSDKLSTVSLNKNIASYKEVLSEQWEVLPDIFITSSKTKKGHADLLKFIELTNNN
ncbi:MAG: ribosome biogenesis GTP-binding protein YihA/YsxC [Solitalea-like symbiont of Acarus siro]